MKLFVALFALVAVAAAQLSNEYLPPNYGGDENPADVTYSTGASIPQPSYGGVTPAHSYSADDGYRYKTQRRRVFKTARRHRRDVSTEYLPPAASAPVANYAEPAASYSGASISNSAGTYTIEAAAPGGVQETYQTAGSAPAHTFSSDDGYRYKTQRRRVLKTARRHRRGVSTEYLPPAASAPTNEYLAPAASAPSSAYLAPVQSYSTGASAPAASFETYQTDAAAPAHSYSEDDGYRYKTQRRRVVKTARRHRRDVSTEYLPPAASAPVANYAEPAASYSGASISNSAGTYTIEAAAPGGVQETYETAGSAPAHTFSSDDGYRYKTQRRRVLKTARRHRRGVSTEYLPPAASAPTNEYLAPAASAPSSAYLAPVQSYSTGASAPAASYETYQTEAAAPAHSYSEDDGYRYKTQRRRVLKTARRHRRGVSTEYLPPAASVPTNEYLAPAASAPSSAYLAPVQSYSTGASAPAASYETYQTEAAAPAHSYSEDDGYRYKTQRRRVLKTARRHRRDVSTEYLPPAASAPAASYAEPAASYSGASISNPAGTYTIEAAAPGGVQETYESAGSAPAHTFSSDEGYRYKTQRRRVIRRRRY